MKYTVLAFLSILVPIVLSSPNFDTTQNTNRNTVLSTLSGAASPNDIPSQPLSVPASLDIGLPAPLDLTKVQDVSQSSEFKNPAVGTSDSSTNNPPKVGNNVAKSDDGSSKSAPEITKFNDVPSATNVDAPDTSAVKDKDSLVGTDDSSVVSQSSEFKNPAVGTSDSSTNNPPKVGNNVAKSDDGSSKTAPEITKLNDVPSATNVDAPDTSAVKDKDSLVGTDDSSRRSPVNNLPDASQGVSDTRGKPKQKSSLFGFLKSSKSPKLQTDNTPDAVGKDSQNSQFDDQTTDKSKKSFWSKFRRSSSTNQKPKIENVVDTTGPDHQTKNQPDASQGVSDTQGKPKQKSSLFGFLKSSKSPKLQTDNTPDAVGKDSQNSQFDDQTTDKSKKSFWSKFRRSSSTNQKPKIENVVDTTGPDHQTKNQPDASQGVSDTQGKPKQKSSLFGFLKSSKSPKLQTDNTPDAVGKDSQNSQFDDQTTDKPKTASRSSSSNQETKIKDVVDPTGASNQDSQSLTDNSSVTPSDGEATDASQVVSGTTGTDLSKQQPTLVKTGRISSQDGISQEKNVPGTLGASTEPSLMEANSQIVAASHVTTPGDVKTTTDVKDVSDLPVAPKSKSLGQRFMSRISRKFGGSSPKQQPSGANGVSPTYGADNTYPQGIMGYSTAPDSPVTPNPPKVSKKATFKNFLFGSKSAPTGPPSTYSGNQYDGQQTGASGNSLFGSLGASIKTRLQDTIQGKHSDSSTIRKVSGTSILVLIGAIFTLL